MGWTANNKYYLTGSITSGLTLSSGNADAGTVPTDLSLLTYDDETHNDSTYEITAIYEGTFESSFSTNDLNWTSVGDSNDIKYQVATSDDGVTYSDYSTLSDAIGTTQISVNAPYFKFRLIWYSSKWVDNDSFLMDSVTRKFTVFVNGGNINANEWMSNYYVCGAEDLLPRGGTTMQLTNNVYDLGSSSYKWKDVYLNEITVDNELGGSLNLVAAVKLSATAQRIEISGLGSETTYFMRCFFVNDTTVSDDTFLFFNQDSASSYGYNGIYSTTGFNATSTAGIYIGECDSGTAVWGSFEGWLNLQASYPKLVAGIGAKGLGTATVGHNFIVGGIYDDTSNTITSLTIFNNSKFAANTEVRIWAKK